MDNKRLIKKIILTSTIKVETGLHIGGSSTSMNIGEVDLNVIKSPQDGTPIIPGSSLKGKLRSLLAKVEGSEVIETDSELIDTIFGNPKKEGKESCAGRLIVRDAFMSNVNEVKEYANEDKYTEVKWENTINRKKGSAEHPRQIERVPKGAEFACEMVLDVYNGDEENGNNKYLDKLCQAIKLLEDDYLGGMGTRGYGKISFFPRDNSDGTIDGRISKTEKTVGSYEITSSEA